jgi:hypothetical protein
MRFIGVLVAYGGDPTRSTPRGSEAQTAQKLLLKLERGVSGDVDAELSHVESEVATYSATDTQLSGDGLHVFLGESASFGNFLETTE